MFTISEKIIAFLSPDTIEPQALQQLINTSESPVLAHHLAVMPDCHYGKGSTVGSVIPTRAASFQQPWVLILAVE